MKIVVKQTSGYQLQILKSVRQEQQVLKALNVAMSKCNPTEVTVFNEECRVVWENVDAEYKYLNQLKSTRTGYSRPNVLSSGTRKKQPSKHSQKREADH